MSAFFSYFSRGSSIEELLDAISSGDINSVAAAITARNINSFSKLDKYNGENPLGLAIRLFIYAKYPDENPNGDYLMRDRNQELILKAENLFAICQLLLERGANPNYVLDGDGQTMGHHRIAFATNRCAIESYYSGASSSFRSIASWIAQGESNVSLLGRSFKIARLLISNGANTPGMLSQSIIPGVGIDETFRDFNDVELAEIFLPLFKSITEKHMQDWNNRLADIPKDIWFKQMMGYFINKDAIAKICAISDKKADIIYDLIIEKMGKDDKEYNAVKMIDLKYIQDVIFVLITKPLKDAKCLTSEYYDEGAGIPLKKLFVSLFDAIVCDGTKLDALDKAGRQQIKSWIAKIAAINKNCKNLDAGELTLIYKVLLSAVTRNKEVASSTLTSLNNLQQEQSPYAEILFDIVSEASKPRAPKNKSKPS